MGTVTLAETDIRFTEDHHQRLTKQGRRWLKMRYHRQHGVCALCHKQMRPLGSKHPLWRGVITYLVPPNQGGEQHYDNTVVVHWLCYRGW